MASETKEVFVCLHCGNKTSHKLLHRHVQKVPLGLYGADFKEMEAENYILLFECSTCQEVAMKSIYSEEIDDPREVDLDKVRSLYPSQREFPENMSKELIKIYQEAVKIKKVSPISFSILIRKALEALCEDQKAKGRNLSEKITNLATKMKLPKSFIDMIESIRLLGNKGAHDLDFTITSQQVDSLDYFFIAIIEYVYIAPQKIIEIQKSLKTGSR